MNTMTIEEFIEQLLTHPLDNYIKLYNILMQEYNKTDNVADYSNIIPFKLNKE